MNPFSCFKRVVVDHPRLGRLIRRGSKWRGKVSLEGLSDADLRIPGSRSGPDASALLQAIELIARWPGLRPAIAMALYEHYLPYREAVDAGEMAIEEQASVLEAPEEVWSHVYDPVVNSRPAGDVVVAFRTRWDVEHTVGAIIRNWSVAEFSGSVGPFEL
jgi:hypothetical protein